MYKLIFTVCLMITSIFLQAQDVQLNKYIDYALKNNPFIKSERLKYQASIELINISNSLDDPTISTGIFISPIETRLGAQKAKISISQKIPWFGSLKTRQNKAKVNSLAVYNNFRNSENRLIYKVKENYYDIFLMTKNISYTKERIEILNKLEAQSIVQFETNKSSMLKILYIQMLRDELEDKVFSYIEKNKVLKAQFNIIINRDKNTSIVIDDSIYYKLNLRAKSLDIKNANNNVKIKQIDAQIKSSLLDEKLQKLQSKPNIAIGLDYAIIANRKDMNPENNGRDAIMPMIKMNIPLWNKKNKSAQKRYVLLRKSLEEKKNLIVNNLDIEYTNTASKYSIAINKINTFDKLIKKTNIVLKIMNTKFENYENGYEELLSMEQKILIYQIKNIQAKVEAIKSLSFIEYLESKK